MARRRTLMTVAAALTATVAGCGGDGGSSPPANLGGETTRTGGVTQNAFSQSAPNLSNEERRVFEIGDSFFNQNWVQAPASTDARDGLGPTFNAQACSSCHLRDGRGQPPDPETTVDELGLLLRISLPTEQGDAPRPVPRYGDQIQDRSLDGVPAEADVGVEYTTIDGSYADGTPYELRKPTFTIDDPQFGPLPDDVLVSPRLAPQVIGAGLVESVPQASIEDAADPDDADGDGISGRTNTVIDAVTGEQALGRFGWKANVASIEGQVTAAFHGDIGITSSVHPDENCPPGQAACTDGISGSNEPGEPELTDDRLGSVSFYSRTLAVPAMRDTSESDVEGGAALFDDFGCASCHTPTLETGATSIAALADQTFHPYTDLLLHDMGEGLADGRPDFEASDSEWRTPPLWGVGLVDEIDGYRFLLHDGRARTLEEAILWHGGEGQQAMESFRTASDDERRALIEFLEAL